jgi:transcriptional regulator with XRE-family HTH domain
MPSLSVHDLGTYLREQRESARLSVRQLSELAGVSNPYLSQIERGLKKPSAEILGQLAKGLRISAESLYVRAGILEERADQMPLETVVLADLGLTERQKRVLLDIYESFRAENARAVTVSEPVPAQPDSSNPAGTSTVGVTRATKATKATKKAAKKAAKKSSSRTGTTATAKAAAKTTDRTTARASKRAAKTTQKRAAAANKSAVRITHPKES